MRQRRCGRGGHWGDDAAGGGAGEVGAGEAAEQVLSAGLGAASIAIREEVYRLED